MNKKLSHINKSGKVNMVDVSDKKDQIRIAKATGFIELQKETINLIKQDLIKKGNVINTAEIAGIQAAKETYRLIPLCHNIVLTKIEVKASVESNGIRVNSYVKTIGKTGAEMEALTAVNIALLTVYDMCKAVDNKMIIKDVKLISKEKKDL